MKRFALLLAMMGSLSAQAAQIRVSPVIVTLDQRENVAVMRLENEAEVPVRVQVRAFVWRQVDGQQDLTETDDVLMNPAQFTLQPHKKQVARLGVMAPRSDVERSYRLLVDEVPDAASGRPGQVQALLRLSIPVFVTPAKPVSRLEWHVGAAQGGRMAVWVVNRGNVHARFSRFTLSSGKDVIGKIDRLLYVLPGSTMRVDIPVAQGPRVGTMVQIAALAQSEEQTVSAPVEAGQGGQ